MTRNRRGRRSALMLAVALTVTGIAASGCGADGQAGTPPTANTPTGNLTTAATPQRKPVSMNAQQVAAALRRHGAPLRVTVVFTEDTDPNSLLGRPGGYASKVAFSDPTMKGKQVSGGKDVARGGTIEVFANVADAKTRSDFVKKTLRKLPILGTEYHLRVGGVLVRLSGSLTPTKVKRYKKALIAAVPRS